MKPAGSTYTIVLRCLAAAMALAMALATAGCGSTEAQGNLGQEQQICQGPQCPCDGSSGHGAWAEPIETDIVGIHAVLLPTGRVLFFGFTDNSNHHGQSSLFDPVGGSVEPTSYAPLEEHPNMFCSGHAVLPDGRVWVAGGHELEGIDGSHTFDPWTRAWSSHGTLGTNRWYPTVSALPDGRAMVIGGSVGEGSGAGRNDTWQIFDPGLNKVTANTSVPFGMELYPFVYVVPGGRQRGKLMLHSGRKTRFLDMATNSWSIPFSTVSPDSRSYPIAGSSVMLLLRPGANYRTSVLLIGGGGAPPDRSMPAVNTVERLDLGVQLPQWRSVAPMLEPRVMPDAVLLPDGTVAVVGGGRKGRANDASDPVYSPEIYDPASDSWSAMCPMQVPRLYHSTALLLPDARVLVAGRDKIYNTYPYNTAEHRVEIFSPPYLFRGARPIIRFAPSTLSYGTEFQVSVHLSGPEVDGAVLMRLGSVTHSFDMGQRGVELVVVERLSAGVRLLAPPDPIVAPPGHYMLFVLSDGVPSRARIVELG